MPTITPVAAPNTPNNPTPITLPGGRTATQQAAIKMLEQSMLENAKSQGQTLPVSNPSRVTPEELSAIKAPEKSTVSDNNVEQASEPSTKAVTKSKEEPLSTQYATLARKEKALRAKALQQEQAYKAREAELIAKEEALKAKDAEYQSKYIPKERLQRDAFSVLKSELGLTDDQITQMALNAPTPMDAAYKAEIDSLKAEIRSLKEETTGVKKSFEERDQRSYQQAVGEIRKEVKSLVSNNPNFETIRATRSEGDVVELIETVFREDGELLSVEEASREVEEYLEREALKLAKLSKIQKRLQTKQAPPAQAAQKETGSTSSPQTQAKTLTNSMGSQPRMSARQRAILAMEGKLK